MAVSEAAAGPVGEEPTTADRPAPRAARRRSWRSTSATSSATSGPTRRRCGTGSSRRGPASTTPRGGCPEPRRPTPAAPTGRCSSTSATSSTGWRSPWTTSSGRSRPTTGRPTTTSTAATSTDSTRRRRERFASLAPAEVRRQLSARPSRAAADRAAARHGDDPERRRLGLGLQRAPRPLSRPSPGHRAVGRRPPCRARSEYDPFGRHPQPLAIAARRGKGDLLGRRGDRSRTSSARRCSTCPDSAWTATDATPGWTIADHVGHLIAWFDEAADAIIEHRRGGPWRPLPPEGLDAWNDGPRRAPARDPDHRSSAAEFEAARSRLIGLVEAMPDEDWLDPESFSWAYEDLHGHVRAHLAMIGPLAARSGWPDA